MTTIPCGCGDYGVAFGDEAPLAIDVVCPKCENHFGYDTTPDDAEADAGGDRA